MAMKAEKTIKYILFTAVLIVGLSSASGSREVPSQVSWCSISLKDLVVDSSIFFTTVLPGESINIRITPNAPVTNTRWQTSGGYLSGTGMDRIYIAPRSPGRYPIKFTARRGSKKLEALIQVFVMVPYTKIRNGYLEGFEIGKYPDPKERNNSPHYQYPRGFIRVTKEDAGIHITENYLIRDFLAHGYRKWPQFVLVNEKLAYKLELVTREFHARGLMKTRFKIFSGFRPPARNTKSGQAEFSRHQYGCAADMIVDDRGRKGWMDDLNGDGRVNLMDALVIYTIIDTMEAEGKLKGIEGGIGAYPGRRTHGPFVHVDYRGGRQANWIHDERGHKVKNLSAFLKKNQYAIRIPPKKYEYSSRSNHIIASARTMNVETVKDRIRILEEEVVGMERKWEKIEGGPKPLKSDDLYVAADVMNNSMMLNRGRIIIKRMPIHDADPSENCPEGIGKIYQTPEGILEIRAKSVSPVWFPPSWAFLGLENPVKVSGLRHNFFKKGVAEKTLDLGAGMRIHSSNLQGDSVLPGSIAVSSKNLDTLRQHASRGTRVYLYEGGAIISGKKIDPKKKKDLAALQSFLVLRKHAADLDRDHLVFDMKKGRGWIKRGDVVVRTLRTKIVGPCFSKAFSNPQKHFNMPRGMMFVKSRLKYPDWYKPDWMYEKQNKTVPDPLATGRVQRGLLGDYGFYLGGGIVIHGRHNKLIPSNAIDYVAIELDASDLKWVWNTVPEGGVVILR